MKNVRYALAFAGLLVTLDAFAQQQVAAAPAHSEKIEVTGSNIPRVDAEGALPLQVITREDLAKGSIMTAQDVIDRISAHQSYGAWTEMKGVGSSEFGNTSASLRGLKPDVPITACTECHNKDGLRQDLSKELMAIDKNRSFTCVYCHSEKVGNLDPPASHYLIAERPPLKRKDIK